MATAAAPSPADLNRAVFVPMREAGAQPQDGSAGADDYSGAGASQLRMAVAYIKQRDEELGRAAAALAKVHEAMDKVAAASGEREQDALRKELLAAQGKPLEDARLAMLAAVRTEKKRVFLLTKAQEQATEKNETIPNLDPKLIERMAAWLASNKPSEAVDVRLRAYRSVIGGLIDFLDHNEVASMIKMKSATEDAPDLAIAHMYLGSLLFLVQNPDGAVAEWKKVLELEPNNEAVKEALRQHTGRR